MRNTLLGVLATTALVAAGCGAEDFENEQRPPSPIELTAAVDDEKVKLSPSEVGGGPAVITVSNTSDDAVVLVVDGPTTGQSLEIGAGTTGVFKVELEQGDYEVRVADNDKLKTASIDVGPERESPQNELLLP